LRAPRWDFHDLDSRVGQDGIEHIGELAGAVTHQMAEGCCPFVEVGE
jgi:hypothetical protein